MARRLAVVLLFCSALWAQVSQPVLVTFYGGLNSTSNPDTIGTLVFNDQSLSARNNDIYSLYVTSSTGTWALQLQYSDTSSTGPWTNFGSGSSANQGSPVPIAAGVGHHSWIRILPSGANVGTVVFNYSAWARQYTAGVAGAGTGTVTASLGALASGQPVFGNGGVDIFTGTKTGTGTVAVMNTSPTIITPFIADLTNMQHTHSSAASGGVLPNVAYTNQSNLYVAGATQTFQNDANVAGLATTPSSDPASPATGSIWINNNDLKFTGVAGTQVTERRSNCNVTNGYPCLDAGGRILKASGYGATVYNDQGNAYSTGSQDFSLATSLVVPSGAGLVPTQAGTIAFNSTLINLSCGDGTVNRIIATRSGSFVNGNCTSVSVVGNVVNFIDSGVVCGAGGGSGYATIQVNGTGLAARAIVNFIGNAITGADNGGATRTDVTLSQSPAGSTSVVGTGRLITTTSPVTIGGGASADLSADRTIACPTCTTNTLAATANQVMIGGGVQVIAPLGTLGTTTTVLHGNAAGAPTFSAVDLANDVSGNLGVSHLASGTNAGATTFWRGDNTWATPPGTGTVTSVALSIPNSVFTISGSPVTVAGTLQATPAGTAGGIVYFPTTTSMASTALLTVHALVIGGGASGPSTPVGLGTSVQTLHGSAAGDPSFSLVVLTTDVSGILPVGNGGTGIASGTSGAVLCFTGSTTIASGAALGANAAVKGSGAGACPVGSGVLIDASNNITTPGTMSVGVGGTVHGKIALQELPANGSTTVGWEAPDTITSTVSYQFPNAVPSAANVMRFGAPSAGVSALTFDTASGTGSCTNQVVTALINDAGPTCSNVAGTMFATQTANLIFAGPSSGGAATPTFRTAVKADHLATTVYTDQANTYTAGFKQSFAPNATNPGVNIGSNAGDPSSLSNGDIWYDSTANRFRCRENSVSVNCIAASTAQLREIDFTIDNGTSVIPTGELLGNNPTVDYACTIVRVDTTGYPSGSVTVDIWKAAGAIPTSGNKISASAPLTLSSARINQNGSLTGWTLTVSSGDVFGFSVATATTVTHVQGQIWCQ